MSHGEEVAARDRTRARWRPLRILQNAAIAHQLAHIIDHIRARKHRGPTDVDNLCWSCAQCNAAKGPNVAGHDPVTDELVPLFNPRLDNWSEHFKWSGAVLGGRTPVGRATIDVLRINDANRVAHRQLLLRAGEL